MALNILIVDDSDVIRGMIGRTLQLASIPVGTLFEAANGREALEVLSSSWVDLVLADLNMPVMSGIEMLERMRTNPVMEEIPVVVISSEVATGRVAELADRGIAAWLRKPFTPEELRDVVNRVTSSFSRLTSGDVLDRIMPPVLETFAFVSPDPAPDERPLPPGGEILSATIAFTGAVNGSLTIAAPAELCILMATNVLGTDSADGGALLRGADMLGEIANITCGHLAGTLEAGRHTDIHPPIVERLDVAGWHALTRSATSRFYLIEDQPVLVRVGLRAPELA